MQDKLNIRVDPNLKSALIQASEEEKRTLSDFIREILEAHFCEKITIVSDDTPINSYEKSFEFTSLLTWLFYKLMHPEVNNPRVVLHNLKYKSQQVIETSSFSKELKWEFIKVIHDLDRILLEDSFEGHFFRFPIPGNQISFDYYRLMTEVWQRENSVR